MLDLLKSTGKVLVDVGKVALDLMKTASEKIKQEKEELSQKNDDQLLELVRRGSGHRRVIAFSILKDRGWDSDSIKVVLESEQLVRQLEKELKAL